MRPTISPAMPSTSGTGSRLACGHIHILAAYCIAYCRWREVEEEIAKVREKDPVTRGLLIDGKINPLVKISRNCATELLRFAGEFGFSPAARTRISLGVGVPDNGKFGDLI